MDSTNAGPHLPPPASAPRPRPPTGFEELFERFDKAAGEREYARAKETPIDLPRLLSSILDEADRSPPQPLDPLEQRLVLAVERLRQIGGAGSRVDVVLNVPDRARFDELSFTGQSTTESERDGLRVKLLFSPLWRILVLHASKSEVGKTF